MTPQLVTGPSVPVVSLEDMKDHLVVEHSEQDALIESLQDAAVAHLDGWRGVLGRAIMEQTWRQDFAAWGKLRLAMPDVSSATVTYTDADGDEQTLAGVEAQVDALGPYIVADGPQTSRVRVEYVCALRPDQLPAAQMAVKLLAGHWYANRESVVVGTITANMPLAFEALVSALRWRTV